jgi:hypothetical protein
LALSPLSKADRSVRTSAPAASAVIHTIYECLNRQKNSGSWKNLWRRLEAGHERAISAINDGAQFLLARPQEDDDRVLQEWQTRSCRFFR